MGKESRSPIRFGTNVPIIGGPRNPLDRPPQVRDLLGRVLHEGDLITLHTQQPQIFKIERIEPIVESGSPPGLMKLTAVSVAQFASERDQRNYEFVRISQAAPRPSLEASQGDPDAEARAEVPQS